MDFTFNPLGPFSIIRAARAANKTVQEIYPLLTFDTPFWHQWLFREDAYGDEIRSTGGYPPMKTTLPEPLKGDTRDKNGFPQ